MTETKNLLIEIGTEELPPKALKRLSESFAEGIRAGLNKAQLPHGDLCLYATPRRLAALVQGLVTAQPDRETLRRGPALSAAFDGEGQPTKATLGFARSCGVEVSQLETIETEQGRWLGFRALEKGQVTEALIPDIVRQALAGLPIPKRMRWGVGEAEFVRPVHWVVLLFGNEVIEAGILGIQAGRTTRGHRFHYPDPIVLSEPAGYAQVLKGTGHVIPDFEDRRFVIQAQVEAAAKALGGVAIIDPDLLDEVTALVEWPVVIAGSFDPRFLAIPAEVIIATLKDQQRYFHLLDEDGRLLPSFITVSNIDSSNPETVRRGNERVVVPRLTDAAFFWEQDRRQPLNARREMLKGVVFQKQLGTLHDKSERIANLASEIAPRIGGNPEWARRAAQLSKCDLLTNLVGEFPELQGVMGRYYANHDGEPDEVAEALDEQYLPRFAGDRLPKTPTGQALAIADKLDTLVGVFGIGQVPTGDKDPFALRRAAIGVLRIIIERRLDLDLEAILTQAAANYSGLFNAPEVVSKVFDFMMDRLRGYFLEDGATPDAFEAVVLARRPTKPEDFGQRLRAVMEFRKLPAAESLAQANKRIGNILRQAVEEPKAIINVTLLVESAEMELAKELARIDALVQPKLQGRDYTGALQDLAGLRESVDNFFDRVLVMCDDLPLRHNRLALLKNLRDRFLAVADISRLQG
jgi:glycyl-tRNA synthetase beta chain